MEAVARHAVHGANRLAESYVRANGLGVGSPILMNVFLSV